jgi:ABC-type antimicrobial peptide transport system permease subunit
LRSYVAERLDGERALSKLLALCGSLAIGLAALGLYGITAYGVARRTREIGIRMALGASRADVLRMFVREGLRLALFGAAWGALPAIAATVLLSGLFVGLFPVDVPTLAASAALLAAVTLAAAYLPARRAARLDPVLALRTE